MARHQSACHLRLVLRVHVAPEIGIGCIVKDATDLEVGIAAQRLVDLLVLQAHLKAGIQVFVHLLGVVGEEEPLEEATALAEVSDVDLLHLAQLLLHNGVAHQHSGVGHQRTRDVGGQREDEGHRTLQVAVELLEVLVAVQLVENVVQVVGRPLGVLFQGVDVGHVDACLL